MNPLVLVAFGRRLELGEPERPMPVRRGVMSVQLGRLRHPLGCLQLLAFEQLGVVAQMRRDARVDAVLVGHIVLYQPRSPVPSLSRHRLLDEGPQHRFGKHVPITYYVGVIHHRLFLVSFVEADKVPGEGLRQCAVRKVFAPKARLVPHHTAQSFAVDVYRNHLAGVVIASELIVNLVDEGIDPGDRLELDASQNGTLQGFGEGLLDFDGAEHLGREKKEKRVSARHDRRGRWRSTRTSLSRASKKVKPE